VGASADALGFLLDAGGMLTTPDSRSLSHLFDPQVKSVLGLANPILDFILLLLAQNSR